VDFFVSSGLLQIFYFFLSYFTSNAELVKVRLLLLVISPTSIISQSLIGSGLKFLIGSEANKKSRLLVTRVVMVAPSVLIISILYLMGKTEIGNTLGQSWTEIFPDFWAVGLMILAQAIAVKSMIDIRWSANNRMIVSSKIMLAIFYVPALLTFSKFWGARGCFIALALTNLMSIPINRYYLRRRN
jgi:hypothetical protein